MRKWIGLLLGLLMMLPLGAQLVPEELVCKEHQQFQNQLSRRNNSGVNHGYLIDYNRCKWWVNPIRGPYFKGDVMAHFTVIANTDSVGAQGDSHCCTAEMAISSMYSK
ncbi:MAG: hypothetical protein EBT66_03030 [Bacteroidetes bacterium]|nr:hypothetical protein [Bacteroidota bacterium]